MYSFSRCAFSWRDSTDLFLLQRDVDEHGPQGNANSPNSHLRGSTEMPMVCAIFLLTPADLSSSSVNPRPRRCFTLYLSVGHRITGRRVLTGLGATLNDSYTSRVVHVISYILLTFRANSPEISENQVLRPPYLLGLLDARGPPADLPGGLVEPALDVALPVLVEVRIRHHLVPFRRHLGVLGGPVCDEKISLLKILSERSVIDPK